MEYQVMVDQEAGFAFFDAILRRWNEKKFPFNHPNVVVPQMLIPAELRADRRVLACFYFYVCIYMRGGIESAQAFRALIQLWQDLPDLFDPFYVQSESPADMAKVLKEYIGWDSRAAGYAWVENSGRLMRHWKGDPLLLFKGIRTYEEAMRRLRNKRTKRDKKASGLDGYGFYGFQPKMVSMLIYFFDWEKWLTKRFIYPTPADFHNFRLGFNQGILELNVIVDAVRITEYISRRWRELTMKYMEARGADPVELADAIWLFSYWLCGRSPLNVTPKQGSDAPVSYAEHAEQQAKKRQELLKKGSGKRRMLMQTCLRCPFLDSCGLSIPSGPYYGRRKDGYKGGMLLLTTRLRVEEKIGKLDPDGPILIPRIKRSTMVQHALVLEVEPDG